MVKSFDIKIDIEKDIYSPMQIQFEVSNSDDSVELNFEFVQDDNPFDLTGQTIQLAVSNPSNKIFYQDIQIENPVEGKASAQLSNQGFNQAGLHVSEIYIRDVDNTIVTSPFYFNSRASLIQAETVPTGDGTVDWVNVLNKPSFFPPESHIHAIADVTGLQSALDSLGGGVPADHTHEIADVNGLNTALAGKMDDGDAYLKTETYNKTEIDQMTLGEGGGSPVIVEDNLLSTSTTNALSSNQGRILNETKADVNHTHPEYLTDVPAEYLTESEGDARYQATGTIPAHTHPEYLTAVPPEYLTQTEGDTLYQPKGTYLTDIPAEYLTDTEGDLKYQPLGTYLTDIPAEYLTEVEGDARYQPAGNYLTDIPAHDHAIADVTGLQTALDGKMDDGDAYLKTETYNKGEVYNRTEIDQMTMGDGGGSPVIVEDNLMSTSTTNALSSNQGRILNETKADVDHTHPEYLTTVPPEYLTDAEGDLKYQPIGTYLTDIPAEYLTQTEGDTLYQPKGTYLTDVPAEYLTESEGDLRYQANGTVPAHDHAIADVTGLQTALDSKADVNHTHDEYALVDHTHPEYLTAVPPEYLTATEGDALYQPLGTVPAHTHPEYLTDIPAEYLTEVEGDARYQPAGNYLTDVPPEYLTETEGDLKYQPAGTYLTDVPPEYLTQTEGDTLYQPIGTVPDHAHADYLTLTEGDLRYQPAGNYLTDVPPEYLTQTEGDTLYQPAGTYLTDIPAEYLTQTEGDTLYQPKGTYLTDVPPEYLTDTEGDAKYQAINTVPTHSHTIADVTGLQTALDGKTTTTYVDAGDNYIMNTRMAGLTLWRGSQAEYDVLTPNSNTLYFIVG